MTAEDGGQVEPLAGADPAAAGPAGSGLPAPFTAEIRAVVRDERGLAVKAIAVLAVLAVILVLRALVMG
jgi:hypothetical protein